MNRRIVGPFSRVEGDLEVTLDLSEGRVAEARVTAGLYRGIEQILHGRLPQDALAITPRICGICSVSQSIAAAQALAAASGVVAPPNGRLAHNLVHACENLADHLTHFYLFFMPDLARDVWCAQPWSGALAARFRALDGTASREVLPARAGFLHLMGYLAGKWPHSLALQPGGSTCAVPLAEKMRILAVLREFRRFVEHTLLGDTLENVAGLASEAQLEAWCDAAPHGDFRQFLRVARALQLEKLGRGPGRFLSYGVYPDAQHGLLFPAGVHDASAQPLDISRITEDLRHSWMRGPDEALPPALGVTLADADKEDAYSWCKAPRLAGRSMEVGALARQVVAGHPLILDLVARHGSNVRERVIARLLEFALVLPAMERWAAGLRPGEPFCLDAPLPDEASCHGLTEAARGSLGHWLEIRRGRIANYQIIAPTTWNFSPRDAQNQPGPLEQALTDTPAATDDPDPIHVQLVVRSFDPCMVCTVH